MHKTDSLNDTIESEMDASNFPILLVGAIIVGGVSMLLLARWARKKNTALGGDDSAWRTKAPLFSIPHLFFGSLSSFESSLAKILAWLIILFVCAFLAFALYVFVFFKHAATGAQ